MAWPSVPFPETVRKTSVGRENQILASEIKAAGRFPVIDQGQSFIAGYSDDEDRLITRDLPLIVFGDHTRVVKFIDFPFILGADGTKVLKPREADFDARFFAFALQSLNLPNRGYNRHFTLLKEKRLYRPELDEQRTIGGILRLVERAVEQQEQLLAVTAELKKTLLHQLFTHGMRNEPQKQTDVGLMPTSWNPTPLGTVCEILSSSLSYTEFLRREPSEGSDAVECMGVKVSDMNLPGNENYFIHANLRKSLPVSVAQRKLLPKDVVVFPKRGAAIATNKKRITTTWTVLDPNLIGLKATTVLYPRFLFYWSETFDLRKISEPGPTPQLNKKDLSPVLIPLPSSLLEQKELADAIAAVDTKAQFHRRKHAALSSLFRTLLHALMTAQIRVRDLNLTELNLDE